ncbi:MAG: flagellar biosynthetic protein FliO [Candidatus Magnetoovum sp. WYHC-5]|nr:flagellar biosynthetic protein FliO [Candidatus Magnetoovum sp. WYHC-5]
MTQYLMQAGGALAIVLLLILAAAFVLRKKRGVVHNMSVVEYLAVGPKKGIVAVKVGAEVLLLGVTPTDIRLLKSIDADSYMPEGFSADLKNQSFISGR